MREILPMWRMTCLLKKHGAVWADQISRQEVSKELKKKGMDKIYGKEYFEIIVEAETTTRLTHTPDGTLKVPRKALANMYFHTYCKEYQISDFTAASDSKTRKAARHKWAEANAIIEQCMKKEKPYIKRVGNELSTYIALTPEGEGFADIVGLSKEWVKALGIWWGVGGTVFVVVLSNLLTWWLG